MPLYGQSLVVDYFAYDTTNGTPKTGDASNHTVYIRKDGGSLQTYSGTITEVDATNAPGLYSITLSASDMQASKVTVYVKSSTSGVLIHPIPVFTEGGRLDATVSSRMPAGNVTVGDYAAGKSPAEQILSTGNKLHTTPEGYVTAQAVQSAVTVGDYSVGKSPADYILQTPTNKLLTDTTGRVTVGTNADKSGYSLATSEHSNIATAVWSATTRTLTSFGTLTSDVANAVWNFTIEASQSALAWMRLIGAVLFGKRTYSAGNVTYRDWSDTKNRVVGTEDQDGNRTITSRDGS